MSTITVSRTVRFVRSRGVPVSSSCFFSVLTFGLPYTVSFIIFIVYLAKVVVSQVGGEFSGGVVTGAGDADADVVTVAIGV